MAIGLPSAIYERTWFKDIMNYWLLKSEPDVWSIDEQIKMAEKGASWDGVRNYQAANYLRKMKKKDLPSKICSGCKRPFVWRKKWRLNWERVKYCSKRCSSK